MLFRKGKYFLNNREILGGSNLEECCLGPEIRTLHASRYDSTFVCETFSEALREIRGTFACFIRFYEKYDSQAETCVWIANDAELEIVDKYVSPRRDFLGYWPFPDFPKLARQITLTSDRTFIIRQEWLSKLEELLIK